MIDNYYKLFERIDEGLAIIRSDCNEKGWTRNLYIIISSITKFH